MDAYVALGEHEASAAEEQDDSDTLDNPVPTGPAYALEPVFWRHTLMCAAFGAVMGVCAYLYLQAIEKVQEAWWGDDYGSSAATAAVGNGKWEWVWLMGLGGVAVGVLKLAVRFPAVVHGFFKEVTEQHVEPTDAAKIVVVSMVSLMSGVSLGPEAALGSLGGGLAQAWSSWRGLSKEISEQHVINGIAAAIGPLFPSPAIAVCCLSEIGRTETMHSVYMRSIAMMTVAASTSFAVFFALNEASYLPFDPLVLTYRFQSGDQAKALLIGALGGLVGVLHVVIAGLAKRLFDAIRVRLPSAVAEVAVPALGGLLMGLLAVWAPLTLGSGSKQTKEMLVLAIKRELTTADFLVTAFAKSVAFGVAKGSGFIGGAIFPMIMLGSSLGLAAFLAIDDRESFQLMLSVSCFMVAVPASVMPAPFTLLLMVAFTFQLGAFQATPIFVSCVAAHFVVCGFGIILKLLKMAPQRNNA